MKRENELVIDADGHILEPPDLWEKYIDPKYRDRTIRIRSGDDGWEFLEVDGHAAKYTPKGMLGRISCMGRKMRALARPTPRSGWRGWMRKGWTSRCCIRPWG
jgi:uncharacterized protein